MTNNEAICILAIVVETAKGRCFVTDEAISDAYDMAISALQAQEAKTQLSAEGTTFDLISRQDAIALANSLKDDLPDDERIADTVMAHNEGILEYQTKLSLLPSTHSEIEKRKEESAQNVPKEDLISRKAAIDAMGKAQWAKERLMELPSAQPEPLTDKEQRIFLAAMGREEKICEEVDRNYVREPYEDSLVRVCKEIRRKVKGALWI